MKKLLNKMLLGRYSAVLFFLISAVAVLFNYSYRIGYVFVDIVVFENFSFAMFMIAVFNTIALLVYSALRLQDSRFCTKKAFPVLQCIAELIALIFLIVDIVNYAVGGKESAPVAFRLCSEILPMWLTAVGLMSALFILPYLKKDKIKKAVSALMAVVLVFSIYASLFPVSTFKFTSNPVVFDNGTDYSVVFSTNDNATAYIEYDYMGEHIKKYDENNGRKNGRSRIHTIHIPYEQLSSNSYKVGATRVIDELSYGGRTGKTIESHAIEFNDTFGDEIDVLTVSDWHTFNETAKKATSYLGDYDAVILLGDGAPGFMFSEEVVKYILSFASDVSGGTMPVLFARGNHETRGREAAVLSSYLGIESFYYKTSLGDYDFIVLDSGEDKEDAHPEYGDMVAYEQNRKNMINWLNRMENDSDRKTIALSHSDEICIEEDLSQSAHEKLDALHVSLLLSGHWHVSEFKNQAPYPVLIDGGIEANGKGTYVASKITLKPEHISVISVDSNGEKTIDETVKWR